MGKSLWKILSVAFLLPGGGVAYYFYSHSYKSPADVFVFFLILLWSGWAGALVGGILDFFLRRRSPLEPIFPKLGTYKWGLWLRLMMLMPAAWTVFIMIAGAAALLAGAKKEAAQLVSPEGGLVFAIFLFVFALEGAIIGGVLDLIGRLLKSR